MAAMGKGGKKTPDRVAILINEEVEKIGQNAAARAMKLPLYSVQKYMAGIAEPTRASLEKIADYFTVSTEWLRGSGGLTYEEITDILGGRGIGVPLSNTYETVKIVMARLDQYGVLLPEIGSPERTAYIEAVKTHVKSEGVHFRFAFTDWEALSVKELDSLIEKLSRIRSKKDQTERDLHVEPDYEDKPPE